MKGIYILLLCIFICSISGETPMKREKPTMVLSYFSQHGMDKIIWNLENDEAKPNVEVGGNLKRFISLCLDRTNFDQKFFISPYNVTKNESMEFYDAIVLCLVGQDNYESIGIFNDDELFEALLFERIESIPNSVINPIVNDDTINYQHENKSNETPNCYDFYGLPTKDVLGQRTCLLSVDMTRETNYIYSGPLMGNAMIKNFSYLLFDDLKFCYTTVKESVSKIYSNEECNIIVSLNRVKFQCCCIKTPELCSPKSLAVKNENKLFCLNGHISSNSTNNHTEYGTKIPINGLVDSFCSTSIILTKTLEAFDVYIEYEAIDKCDDEITYSVNSGGKFCSSELGFPNEVKMVKCCKDGHFCNQKFIPPTLSSSKCYFKPNYADYVLETTKCEAFFDIRANRHVNILLYFNAKIPRDQRIYAGVNKTTSFAKYELYYTYFRIIRADSDNCETSTYTSKNVNEYRPFVHFLCETDPLSSKPCDIAGEQFEQKIFECETLNRTLFDENKTNYLTTMNKVNGWICFVEISFNYSSNKYYIRAGETTDFKDHGNCLQNDTNNGTFCCSHVFNTRQNETECTVEKLIAKIRHRKNNPTKNDNGKGYFSNCLTRDLPLDSCLSESGCFETRLLKYSQHSDAVEPAGCIDNTEKNIIQDISMASLSLGCRVDENSNRCSVVQTPEGEQRIVCCCNGKECESDFSKLPKQIGRNISSFKESQ